jgi:hypothetical protein
MTPEINEKDLQDKEDLIKKWVAKFKKAPIQTSIILLMTFGSMGVTTWIGMAWRDLVSSAVVHQLEEEGSDIHETVVNLVDSIAKTHTDSLKTDISVENAQVYAELFTIVKEHGDGSMTDEELSKDVIKKLALMDSMESALPKIEAMTKWMALKMEDGDNGTVMCGYVIAEDDEPDLLGGYHVTVQEKELS